MLITNDAYLIEGWKINIKSIMDLSKIRLIFFI